MFIVKIIIWIVLLALILSSQFFTNLLLWMKDAISAINSDFWAYLPTDVRVFFSLIVAGLLFWLVYAFKK